MNIFKKWWFWLIIIIVGLLCIGYEDNTKNTENVVNTISVVSNKIEENTITNQIENTIPVEEPEEEPKEEIKEEEIKEIEHDYVVNKNTKVFHYYGCSSISNMKEKNKKEISATREEMIKRGYKPCGRCNP